MESHTQTKRRSFIKEKLLSFTRHPKPNPNPYPDSSAYITYLMAYQDMMQPQPRQALSVVLPDYGYNNNNKSGMSDFESYFTTVADENVNMKASVYISSVRDRLELEK
ncbi:hypothetical protein vseg_015860 [Gypsophila vaccaria]